MVQYCVVPGCRSNARTRGISFHSYPKDQELFKQWVIKIRRDCLHSVKVSEHMKVCSKHFKDSDYKVIVNGVIKRLKDDAVPSIFSFTSARKIQPRREIIRVRSNLTKKPKSLSLNTSDPAGQDSVLQPEVEGDPHHGMILDTLSDSKAQNTVNKAEGRNTTSPGQELPESFGMGDGRDPPENLEEIGNCRQSVTGIGTVHIKEEHREEEEEDKKEVPINVSFAYCPVKSESAEESPVLEEHNYCNVIADSDGECCTAPKLECFTEPWPELDPLSLAQEPGIEAQLAERRDAETMSAVPQQPQYQDFHYQYKYFSLPPRSAPNVAIVRNLSPKKQKAGAGNYKLKSFKTNRVLKKCFPNCKTQQTGISASHSSTDEAVEYVLESNQAISRGLAVELQDVRSSNSTKQPTNEEPFKVRETFPTIEPRKVQHSHSDLNLPLPCSMCQTVLATDFQLQWHMQSVHGIKKQFPCGECNELFQTRKALTSHRISHQKERTPFKCGVCGKTFPDVGKFRSHMICQGHDKKRPFKCGACAQTFLTINSLKSHCMSFHLKRPVFKCSICGASFHNKLHLELHKTKPHCNQPSEVRGDLMVHVHSDRDPDCRMLRSRGVTRFKCGHCPLTFPNEWLVASHIRECHPKPEDPPSSLNLPFSCGTCDKAFVKKAYLEAHYMLSHSGHPEFACNVCDVRFELLWQLKTHMVIHQSGPFKYQCGVCADKTFQFKNDLREHTFYHVEGNLSHDGMAVKKKNG